jgi:glycosyltransferase involved in cell wall biosynthesis
MRYHPVGLGKRRRSATPDQPQKLNSPAAGRKSHLPEADRKTTVEINLFTFGDSADISTWSNLPYFFSKALIAKGVRLNRINLYPTEDPVYRGYRAFFKRCAAAAARCGINLSVEPYRDLVSIRLIDRKIKREIRNHPRAEANVFLTFTFSSYLWSRTPAVNYCDETYAHYLQDTGRSATRKDRHLIAREDNILTNASWIFTTGQGCAEFIHRRHPSKHVQRLPFGINLDDVTTEDGDQIIAEKRRNKSILFIGMGKKKRGIDVLIDAFKRFNRENGEAYTLHIVGLPPEEAESGGPNIRGYGYLNKHDSRQFAIYRHLLKTARLFVMPMQEGPLPGVILEAGLMYTPVIITDIWNVSNVIQHDVNGLLVARPSAADFADRMHVLANDDGTWERIARNAHGMTQRFSWNNAAQVFCETLLGNGHETIRTNI